MLTRTGDKSDVINITPPEPLHLLTQVAMHGRLAAPHLHSRTPPSLSSSAVATCTSRGNRLIAHFCCSPRGHRHRLSVHSHSPASKRRLPVSEGLAHPAHHPRPIMASNPDSKPLCGPKLASSFGNPAHLLPPSYASAITHWLQEDTPSFDCGGFVVGSSPAEARLLGKSEGILAGVPFVDEVFRQLGCTVEWHAAEGTAVTPIHHVATVRGPARNILLGERVALNILARCSGVASKSASLLRLLREAGYKHILAGTRKTTPGFRIVEKYGMIIGGCDPHRHDLSTMTMLKDNHVDSSGSITSAVQAARAAGGFALKVEVECRTYDEANEAIQAGADIVMLDNFSPQDAQTCAAALKAKWGRDRVLIEISGGLTEENVSKYVCDDIDVISTSSIHQGVRHVDFSLKIVQPS